MRALVLVGVLALAGCAAGPPVGCPDPVPTAASDALASQGYALAGRVNSLLLAGKLSGQKDIALNQQLQSAQADIRTGKIAKARALIDSVSAALPQ